MALFSYLAVARPRGFHRRDTICGLFWPEVDQGRARAALRQALHLLRQSLGQEIVLNRGPEEIGIQFSSVSCDAIEFEEALERGDAEAAVAIYGGPLLHGFYLSDTPEFERWLGVERDRLALKYSDALRSLACGATDRADHVAAARWWKRLANHDPYSPEIALQVMSALDASGERAAAIEHARIHAAAVKDDLEMLPDVGVQEYAARLKAEPSHRPVPPRARPGVPERAEVAVTVEPQPATPTRPQPRRMSFWYAIGGSLVALILLGAYALVPKDADVTTTSRLSLGILPFENLGSPEDEYFVNGLAEDLASRLAGVEILSILVQSDVAYGGSGNLPENRETAGDADYSLRIAVERFPGPAAMRSTRVMVSLRRNEDGVQQWSDSLEVDPTRLFELQAQLAEAIPRALGIPVLGNERDWLRTSSTNNLRAYDQYLRGVEYLRSTSEGAARLMRAVELFRSSLTLDTGFVHAYARLSITHTLMFSEGVDRSLERLVDARTAADRAVLLRADAPISHLAQAWYHYLGTRDYDRALRHFEFAGANWAGLSDVRVLIADIRRRQGDLEQALTTYAEALAANPACGTCAAEAALTSMMLGDYEHAEREARRALRIAPGVAYAGYALAAARIASGDESAAARSAMRSPRSLTDQGVVELAAGPWGAFYRIVGGAFEERLDRVRLSSAITDTAGYYLAKADLAERSDQPTKAGVYYDSARVVLEPMVRGLPGDASLRARLGLAYAGLDMRALAVTEGLEGSQLLPLSADLVDGAFVSEMLARIYMKVGEADDAIERLELLLSGSTPISKEALRLDPVWEPLRVHPRFQRLVR